MKRHRFENQSQVSGTTATLIDKLGKVRASVMCSRCIYVAITASINVNCLPFTASLMRLRLLSCLLWPSRLKGHQYLCALRFLLYLCNMTSFPPVQHCFVPYTRGTRGKLTTLQHVWPAVTMHWGSITSRQVHEVFRKVMDVSLMQTQLHNWNR